MFYRLYFQGAYFLLLGIFDINQSLLMGRSATEEMILIHWISAP